MRKMLLFIVAVSSFQAFGQMPQLVHDINPGATSSSPGFTAVFNGKLYFAASDPTNGRELRVYDGTGIPSLLYNINPAAANGISVIGEADMPEMNGKMYFAGNNGSSGTELMVYDGVNPPTLAADINPGASGSSPVYLFSTGNKLFFNAANGTAGFELFVYDGVAAPVVFDIYPGGFSSNPYSFEELNNKVYFKATDSAHGAELFVYDPVTNSVALAYDINSGVNGSNPANLVRLNNKLYFTATTSAYGRELYSFDGTTAIRLTDVNTTGNGVSGSPAVYNNIIYFCGSPGVGNQLYKYDPATNTTALVYTINPGNNSSIARFKVYGGKLYFNAITAGEGNELWVHDGTTTTMVADIYPGTTGSVPREFEVYDGKLYFSAEDGVAGEELFSLTDPLLSVQNTKLDGVVTVQPNPTSNEATLQLTLNTATALHVQITDVAGKLIWESETANYPAGTNTIALPFSGSAPGTYFYRLSDTRGTLMASGKLIKQ